MTPRECYRIAADIRIAFTRGPAAEFARAADPAAFDTVHANAATNTLGTLTPLCPKLNTALYLKRCGV